MATIIEGKNKGLIIKCSKKAKDQFVSFFKENIASKKKFFIEQKGAIKINSSGKLTLFNSVSFKFAGNAHVDYLVKPKSFLFKNIIISFIGKTNLEAHGDDVGEILLVHNQVQDAVLFHLGNILRENNINYSSLTLLNMSSETKNNTFFEKIKETFKKLLKKSV